MVQQIGASLAHMIKTADGERVIGAVARGSCVCGADHGDRVWLLPIPMAAGLIANLTACMLDSGLTPADVERLVAGELAGLEETGNVDAGYVVAGCPTCRRAEPECVCEHRWAVR